MKHVITADGDYLGKLLYFDGHKLYIRPVRYLRSYYINDPSYLNRMAKDLFEERSLDPKHRKVVLALVELLDPIVLNIHPQHPPILNVHNPDPDALILLYDRNGNPIPFEAFCSGSMEERKRLSGLYRFCIAQRAAYEYMVRQLDNYRQLVISLEQLLEHRDAEVEALMNANRELASVVNSITSEIQTLRFMVLDLEARLRAALQSKDAWYEIANEALSKQFPALVNALNKLAEQVSSEVVRTMRSHVRDLQRESALMHVIDELRERIKAQTEQIAKLAAGKLEESKSENQEESKEEGGEGESEAS